MKKNNVSYYPLLNNYDKVESIFGKDFLYKSENDLLTSDDFFIANDILSKKMYGDTIAKFIKEQKTDQLDHLYNNLLSTMPNRNLPNEINLDNIGMILIRPETFGEKERYINFLKSLKLELILEKDFQLFFEQYWILYHHGLKHKDSTLDFPTRTFNYINNDVCLLVFTGDRESLNIPTISDYLFMYKGKHGSYIPNTLRGDIAFNSLRKYLIDKEHFVKEANIPLDPIGAYRMLIRGKIESDRCHESADIPLLFYSAQAVHIPNRYEIHKDLNILCDDSDIETIAQKIKKR